MSVIGSAPPSDRRYRSGQTARAPLSAGGPALDNTALMWTEGGTACQPQRGQRSGDSGWLTEYVINVDRILILVLTAHPQTEPDSQSAPFSDFETPVASIGNIQLKTVEELQLFGRFPADCSPTVGLCCRTVEASLLAASWKPSSRKSLGDTRRIKTRFLDPTQLPSGASSKKRKLRQNDPHLEIQDQVILQHRVGSPRSRYTPFKISSITV